MEKLAIVLMVFVLLGSMSPSCDGIAAGEWVLQRYGKRNYEDLNDGYNEVTRSNYRMNLQRKVRSLTTQSKPNFRRRTIINIKH